MRKVMISFFYSLLLLMSVAAGSEWKTSLNFEIDGVQFSDIDLLHKALSDKAQAYTEEAKRYPQNAENSPDSIGEPYYEYRRDGYDTNGKKNTENAALATLQIIIKSIEEPNEVKSIFSALKNSIPSLKNKNDPPNKLRVFSSKANIGNLLLTHTLSKEREKSLPSSDKFHDTAYLHLDRLESGMAKFHSENVVFSVLNRTAGELLETALKKINFDHNVAKIIGVVLHLHTRLDMCGRCTHYLQWELNNEVGFAAKLIQKSEKMSRNSDAKIHFMALVSSRQDYLVWGKSRRTVAPEALQKAMDLKPIKIEESSNDSQRVPVQAVVNCFLQSQKDNDFYKKVIEKDFFTYPANVDLK